MDQLTSAQISEWEAFDKIDPIGSWRDDFRTAHLISQIVNIVNQLYAKKGAKPTTTTPMDFMPDWSGENEGAEPKKQSVEEMKQILLAIASQSKKGVNIPIEKKTKPPKR